MSMLNNQNNEILSPNDSVIRTIDQKNQEAETLLKDFQQDGIVLDDQSIRIEQKQSKMEIATVLKELRFKQKIEKIKELSAANRFQKLKDEDFELIGDKTYYQPKQISWTKFKQGRIHKVQDLGTSSMKFIIDPDGALNSILSLLFSIFGYIQFIIAPISFCFPEFCEFDSCQMITIIDYACIIVFSVKILTGFLTAYKQQNFLINSYREIRLHYAREELFFDLLPIGQIFINLERKYPFLGIIYLFRIFNYTNSLEKFCNFFNVEEKFIAFYHISRLVLLIISVAHYNALAFYYISQTGESKRTWIQTQDLFEADWFDIYERGLYFIIITMITVGFGDITPVTSRERIYLIVMTLFSCFLFGYAVNTVGSIFQQKDFQDSLLNKFLLIIPFFLYRKKKFQISNYLLNRGVEKEISRKVLREIDYINEMERNGLFDDQIDVILKKVSVELKEQVQSSISLKILRSCPLLNNILSLKCLNEYTKYMKEKTLIPGQIIYQKGITENQIYFINKGEIQIYLENGNKEEEIVLRRIGVKNFNKRNQNDFFINLKGKMFYG